MSFVMTNEINENSAQFDMKDTNLAFANGIRRIIHAEIPNIMVDKESVVFKVNTSVIHEKMFGSRLESMPTKYAAIVEEIGNLELYIKKENNEHGIVSVYLSDFEIRGSNKKIEDVFVYPKSLIGKLKYGQKIEMSAKFKEGIAKKDGALFSHAAGVGYSYKKSEEKDEKRDEDEQPTVFSFNVETSGTFTVRECVAKAFEVLINKLNASKGKIKMIERANVQFVAYDFIFEDEDDTLGNLVQTYLLEDEETNFAGYMIPHPLTNILVIRLSLNENNTMDHNREVFERTIDKIVSIGEKLALNWKQI